MPTEAKLIVTAETSAAISNVLKLAEAQQKVEASTRDLIQGHKEHNKVLEQGADIAKEFRGEIIGMVSAFFSMEGVKKIIEDVTERLKRMREENARFWETGGTKAGSLPVYLQDQNAFKQESAGLSTQFGLPVEQVNQLRYLTAIRSPAGTSKDDLNATVKSLLKFGENTGESPEMALNVSRDLRNAYPGLNQEQAENISLNLRNKNGLTMDRQQESLAPMLVTAQALGLGVGDVGGVLNLAARSGGVDSATGKALITAFTKIPELQQAGLIKGGGGVEDLFQQLDALQKSRPGAMNDIFKEVGPKAFGAISFAAQHGELFKQGSDAITDAIGGKPLKELDEKMEGNVEIMQARQASSAAQGAKNKLLTASPATLTKAQQMALMTAGNESFGNTDLGEGFTASAFQSIQYGWNRFAMGFGLINPNNRTGKALIGMGEAAAINENDLKSPIDRSKFAKPSTQPSSDGVSDASDQIKMAGQLLIGAASKMAPQRRVVPREPGGLAGPR